MRGHQPADPVGLPDRGHVCLVVSDDDAFTELVAAFLAEGDARREKTIAFGPANGRLLAVLEPLSAVATDPHVAFLGRRGLEPGTMITVFREQAELAVRQGYTGIRVAADMDWLLPAAASAEQVVGFEVLLDRVVREVGATVLCAYRRNSFDRDTIVGTLSVHPVRIGHDEEPPFTLVAAGGDSWRLAGSLDMAGADHFAGAFAATATSGCVLDASDLEFIDVAGMRAIAEVARSADVSVQLRNAPRSLERYWRLAGFDRFAPTVQVGA